ncbi:hypothetical protein O6H91_06G107100 [Diphasiastrum complanatum]|uniref:Uncharacterized protein n=1 Tax=Diphasiastrum complanatum TaxID=34168 RepID=A0ACC2DHD1_DIPCM|nr:hypothetical protein O6H91_06G107100 [Diphasiastrum complanatum]
MIFMLLRRKNSSIDREALFSEAHFLNVIHLDRNYFMKSLPTDLIENQSSSENCSSAISMEDNISKSLKQILVSSESEVGVKSRGLERSCECFISLFSYFWH